MHRFAKKRTIAWLGALALIAGARIASPQTPTPSSPVAITDVTVIDVSTGARHAGGSVLIQGGMITAIGP